MIRQGRHWCRPISPDSLQILKCWGLMMLRRGGVITVITTASGSMPVVCGTRDGGGLSARGRVQRERVRLEAARLFEQGVAPVLVAWRLRVSTKSAYQSVPCSHTVSHSAQEDTDGPFRDRGQASVHRLPERHGDSRLRQHHTRKRHRTQRIERPDAVPVENSLEMIQPKEGLGPRLG